MHLHPLAVGLVLALPWSCLASQPAASEPSPASNASPLAVAPYLQALSPGAVAIHWQSAEPAYGWIEYGESPQLDRRRDRNEQGLRAANTTHHQVVLTDLKPGTQYSYRVHTRPIRNLEAYRVEFGPEDVWGPRSFQTLPAEDQSVTALVFNDLHNNVSTFQRLRQAADDEPFHFSLFNGDCWADPAEETATLQITEAFMRGVQADTRPAFVVRGNHETRGAYARRLPDWFSWPDSRPYFAFTAGPVRWVILDCGEDKPDDHPEYYGLVDFSAFRRDQTEWLKKELSSAAFREAPWRVLVHHIPLYSERAGGGFHAPCRDLWGDLLAQANIDLALNGHTHHRAFHPTPSIGNPYPIAIGGGPGPESAVVMLLKASQQQLTLRVLDVDGREVFPTFRKTPQPTP